MFTVCQSVWRTLRLLAAINKLVLLYVYSLPISVVHTAPTGSYQQISPIVYLQFANQCGAHCAYWQLSTN